MYDIELYSQTLINEMVRLNATDLHIIPQRSKYELTYRQNGKLRRWKEITLNVGERIISHFKYQSGMDIGERRKPQSSSFEQLTKKGYYSIRLSTLPTQHKESLALRFLPHFSSQWLQTIPLLQHSRKMLSKLTELKHGLCLLSGPTGSGKSTTLYAVIEQLMLEKNMNIITIEDPIERPLSSVIQVEVNQRAGMTYDKILRESLRHDPDAFLIGEIRDEKTAKLAIRASLTGHLVFASIHASSSSTALLRMLELGVSSLDLSECCSYVLSQRLIETICPLCDGTCHPYCIRHSYTRAAIFDVLTGKELEEMIHSKEMTKKNSFLHSLEKAWALGYITHDEVVRMAHET